MRNELRSPRIRASLSGFQLSGLLSAEVETNNHFAADRFRLRFAANGIDQDVLHIPGRSIEVEVGDGGDWKSCIVGLIDQVAFDPVLGVIDVDGRDLSSQLIESQIDETFSNRTSSEIATLFGLRHGLLVAADPTSTPIGRYYQSEHDRIALGQYAKATTEWDLLAFLAVREGFDLFVSGRTLHFGVPILTDAAIVRPEDCISLQLGHAVSLARPIDVLVRSWNSKTGEVVQGEALGFGVGPVWQRKISRPNLTNSSAQQQAQRTVADLKRHEWTARCTMPGETSLSARSIVVIEDTNSPWDRLYQVIQISRRLDIKHGFTQTLSLTGVA